MIYVVVISLVIIGLYATALIPVRRGKGKKNDDAYSANARQNDDEKITKQGGNVREMRNGGRSKGTIMGVVFFIIGLIMLIRGFVSGIGVDSAPQQTVQYLMYLIGSLFVCVGFILDSLNKIIEDDGADFILDELKAIAKNMAELKADIKALADKTQEKDVPNGAEHKQEV